MVRTSGPRRIGEASEIGGEGFGYRFPVLEPDPKVLELSTAA
jgi:hypothetical protein